MTLRTIRPAAVLLGLGLLTATACASGPAETVVGSGAAQPPSESAITPAATLAPALERGAALARSPHDAEMSEVVLDARGGAALTLDVEGGVRLWTGLQAGEADAPLSLPVQEPSWMSLARAEDGGFVVAFIDTTGGGRVARVEVEGSRARMISAFEIPITDPLFELHVLDGGQRILALGLDHRVRLYDRSGTLVGAVDQPGFVPWQLRVSETPGQAPAIVAVLAGPTRVQPIAVDGDQLVLRGEPRTVALDQGPNRNDLTLSPSGRTAVALRRPRSKGKRFTIELVDLESDERRVLAGEVDGSLRPRMHVVDDERVLLESGTGQGFWVELSAAVPWTEGTGRKQTEALPLSSVRKVALPASAPEERKHTTVIAGVRAVPTPHALVIDALDESGHLELAAAPVQPRAVALDATGTRVAWSSSNAILLDETDGGGALRELLGPGTESGAAVVELAFVGDDQLLAVASDGSASLLSCSDGQTIASTRVSMRGDVSATSFRRDAASGGSLALRGWGRQDPLAVVAVDATGFGESRSELAAQRVKWSALGVGGRDLGGVLDELRVDAAIASEVDALVLDPAGHGWLATRGPQPFLYRLADGTSAPTLLRQGAVQRLVSDPTGHRLAVVQLTHRSTGVEGLAAANRFAVSVLDAATRERVWTRAAIGFQDLEWSADGTRVAVGDREGGVVIDSGTGELVHARRHRALEVTAVPSGS